MDATVTNPVSRPDLSAGMSRANNVDFNLFSESNYMMTVPPQYFVYIYTVSMQGFEVSRPPLFRDVKIPGRVKGERYKLVTKLPQPVLVPKGNVDSNDVDVIPTDARRIAMDIINPNNLGLDQDAVLDPRFVFSQGNDLGARGVFWSFNGPGADKYGRNTEPTEEEVKKAYTRLERHYNRILEEARAVETSDPASLSRFLAPEHHHAADYFGLEFQWHGKKTRPVECPICGDRMREGAAFHKTEDGTLCINDWKRAVAAGVRTRAQAYEATDDPFFAPKVPQSSPSVAPVVSPKNSTTVPEEQ